MVVTLTLYHILVSLRVLQARSIPTTIKPERGGEVE
jgi:hypothetical protein